VSVLGLTRKTLQRTGKWVPLARLLLVAELAVQAGRHITKLEPAERARLVTLLRRAKGRPSALAESERAELAELVARMEPQVFLAKAVNGLSPIPVPRRVVERGANAVGRALRRGR
jgi:hypothetical protein